MEKIKEIRTLKITDEGQICIPNLKGFQRGSEISILIYSDKIELKPQKNINEDMLPTLMSEDALSKDWDNPEEDEIWKDL